MKANQDAMLAAEAWYGCTLSTQLPLLWWVGVLCRKLISLCANLNDENNASAQNRQSRLEYLLVFVVSNGSDSTINNDIWKFTADLWLQPAVIDCFLHKKT